MSNTTNEVVSVEQNEDRYWRLGMAFVQVVVNELNGTLIEHGVTAANDRREMCLRLAFGVGNFLDQYWMEVDGQKRFPLLCFTDKFLNIGDTTKSVEPIQLPARDFEFHGAAHSVVSDFFDSQGEELKVPIGVYEEN